MSKRTIRVTASVSGKISTGSFENLNPGFSCEEIFDIEADPSCIADVCASAIQARAEELHTVVYDMFKGFEQKAIVERIQKERRDLRFYSCDKCGKQHPSVTSILNYDADFFMPPYQLQQHASLGNIKDARAKHFVLTGKWVEPKELQEIWGDIVIVTKGDLNLNISEGNFENFVKDYPFKKLEVATALVNCEEGYAGTPDLIGVPDAKNGKWPKLEFPVEETLSMVSLKSSYDKEKNLCQEAAYIKADKRAMRQMIVVALNENAQGYSKPIVSDKVDFHYTIFKNKKKQFSLRYGL